MDASSSDNVRRARAFLTYLERREAGAIADLLSEHVVQVLPLSASGGIEPAAAFTGRDAVLHVQTVLVGAFSSVAFLDPHVTVSADGNAVFVETVGRRVQVDTDRVYENVYLLKFDFDDGLICRITEYSNPVTFAKFFEQPLG